MFWGYVIRKNNGTHDVGVHHMYGGVARRWDKQPVEPPGGVWHAKDTSDNRVRDVEERQAYRLLSDIL